jgi:hypothetical protein
MDADMVVEGEMESFMKHRIACWGRVLMLLAAATTLSGCFVAADLIEEDLLRALGINPRLLGGEPGKIVVAFNNTTRAPAEMFVLFTDEPTGTDFTRERSLTVSPGEVRNAVIDCPVTSLTPGRLGAGATEAARVTPTGAGGPTAVPYLGVPLGRADFACGDLIVVTLSQIAGAGGAGTEQQATYAIRVRVVPGQ